MNKKVKLGLMVLGLLLSPIGATVHANTRCLVPSKMAGADATAVACDVTFSTTPTFSCDDALPQAGVYTIRNNTPVTTKLNYIRIQNNDANPTADVTITANTCGATLAVGASCSVTVTLANEGPFSRILEIGVDSRQVQLDSPVINPTTGCNTPTYSSLIIG